MALIQNASDLKLQSLSPRTSALSAPVNSPNLVFTKPRNQLISAVTPSSITLTCTLPAWTPVTTVWEYSIPSASTTWITISGEVTNTLVLSNTTFLTHLGTDTKVLYRITLTHPEWVTISTTKEIEYRSPADDAPSISFNKESVLLPVALGGAVTYTGSGVTIGVSKGGVSLNYAASGANTYDVSASATGVTLGTPTGTVSRVYSDASAIVGDTATSTFTITIRDSFNVASVYTRNQNFSKTVPGATGADGTKAITLSCFKWATGGTPAIPTHAFTLTWPSTLSGTPNGYPEASGWYAAATTSPGTAYVLYMLNVVVTDVATATTTAYNWSNGTIGSIGYNIKGDIGVQGDGARIMYAKYPSGTTFSGTSTVVGDFRPPLTGTSSVFGQTATAGTTWLASPPTIVADESLFQSDGIFVIGGNTTWQTPYLSNLKVGSLSAISAELGTVSISTVGALYSGKSSYASGNAGFFMGYDSSTIKFRIGNAGNTKALSWDGTDLTITGQIIGGSISYGKVSFADTAAGYWLSSDGLNLGSGISSTVNGYATYKNFKFDTSTGSVASIYVNGGSNYRNIVYGAATLAVYTGLLSTSISTNDGTTYSGIVGEGVWTGTSTSATGIRAGVTGVTQYASSNASGISVGVIGYGYNIGVYAQSIGANSYGLYGRAESGSVAVLAQNMGAGYSGTALEMQGKLVWNGIAFVNPPNTLTTNLRGDGTFGPAVSAYYDSGTTNALSYNNGTTQRWAPSTGAQTLTITNWPAYGLGELFLQGVNLGASTITWPTINWVKSDGSFTTTFSSNGVTLQTSGIDFVYLWTRDAGTTVYGKIVR